MTLLYQTGFGNHFATEALAGALPIGQNSPQQLSFKLYAEQISGTAFTESRSTNQHTWVYRRHPSVITSTFEPYDLPDWYRPPYPQSLGLNPNPMRWLPHPLPLDSVAQPFIQGCFPYASQGNLDQRLGAEIYVYALNASMNEFYYSSADGEFLFLPQEGKIRLRTELGVLEVEPGYLAVIPKGLLFQVELLERTARGYLCENYGPPLRLPELGLIGANGLANRRDFEYPIAHFEDKTGNFIHLHKLGNRYWQRQLNHSPLNVVAWQGNYAPYRYNLNHFNALNTVTFDHPDPSIFTVLTSPSPYPGIANFDLVIFPPRWSVAEHSFRPPYFHRNTMNEWMGLLKGVYEGKEQGFLPGGASLHNMFTPHGPDKATYDKGLGLGSALKPTYYSHVLAFMLESYLPWHPSQYALHQAPLDKDYLRCWEGL